VTPLSIQNHYLDNKFRLFALVEEFLSVVLVRTERFLRRAHVPVVQYNVHVGLGTRIAYVACVRRYLVRNTCMYRWVHTIVHHTVCSAYMVWSESGKRMSRHLGLCWISFLYSMFCRIQYCRCMINFFAVLNTFLCVILSSAVLLYYLWSVLRMYDVPHFGVINE